VDNDHINKILAAVKSKGYVMSTVSDGRCYFFSKGFLQVMVEKNEDLKFGSSSDGTVVVFTHARLQALLDEAIANGAEQVHFFLRNGRGPAPKPTLLN